MTKKFILSLTLLFCSLTILAQRQNINGSIIDTSRTPLVTATVMLMTPDSIFKSFATTDGEGDFVLESVPQGDYYIQVNFLGYLAYFQDVVVGDKPVDLGVITMQTESKVFDEVVVMGERNPVEINKDTISYNAASFKTQVNADVEALLKKLPGVEVDRDGNIKAQGEDVNRVLVDGKEFFGTDPKIATKNLPAEAVEKVQVFDKKSEEAEFTGIDDGERNKTINIELKDTHKKGTFGNVEAGGGDEGRYEGRLSLNRFSDKSQISILGMGNNTNQLGFSFNDYVSFSGGMSNAFSGGGGRFRSGGGTGGIPLDFNNDRKGINSTWAGGVNFNKDWGKKTKLRSNYFYNWTGTDLQELIDRKYTLPDRGYSTFDDMDSDSKQFNHRINATFEHELNNGHSLRLTSNITIAEGNNESTNANQIVGDDGTLQNDDNRNNTSSNNQLNINTSLLYRKKFKKKGRSLSATLALSDNDHDTESTLESMIGYYLRNPRIDTIEQLSGALNDSRTYRIESSFSEPLGNNWFAQVNYRWRKNDYDALVNVYDDYLTDPLFNSFLSNHYQNGYLYNQLGFQVTRSRESSSLTIGADYQNSSLDGKNISDDVNVNRNFNFILPYLRYNYYFTSMKSFRLRYNAQVREPNVQQLQPVRDNSDPLNLRLGNPDLKPEYSHSANLGFSLFDQFNFITFFSNVRLTYTKDKISTQQTIDDQNVRISKPINVKDDFTTNGFISFGAPIKPIKWTFNLSPSVTFNRGISYINEVSNITKLTNHRYTLRFENRKKELFDVGLGGTFGFNNVTYDINEDLNQKYINHRAFVDFGIISEKILTFNTSFDYSIYENKDTGLKSEIPVWNASISKTFLKNKVGELKFAAFDLLDRRQGITQDAALNYIETRMSNTLGRYFLLSFRYNIRTGVAPAPTPNFKMWRGRR